MLAQDTFRSRFLPAVVLACLFAGPALALRSNAAEDELAPALESLGRELAARVCGDGADSCDLDALLAAGHLRLSLGAYDLYYPREALDHSRGTDALPKLLSGVLAGQMVLVRWLVEDPERRASLEADAALLSDWIGDWRGRQLGKAAGHESDDLLVAMGAEEEESAAAERLRAAFADCPGTFGLEPRNPAPVRIVLCPERRDFAELVGFMGLRDAEARKLWDAGIEEWTYVWWGWSFLLAMEYSPWSGFDPKFRSGKAMDDLSPSGLVEHTNQQITKALMLYWFGRPEPRHLEKGLAINLVLASSGRANTLDGEGKITTSGATTAPYSRFVPGGNPSGGTLPAISAAAFDSVVESSWREGHGKDLFHAPLKKGQKAGAKLAAKKRDDPKAKDPLAHFVLSGDEGGKHVASAPFLGPHANEQQYPPAEFLNDFREFFRSYQTSFLAWLEREGAASPEESAAAFRELLRGLTSAADEAASNALFERIYGMPLSARDGSSPSLEWRFLEWLSSGKPPKVRR